MSKEECEQKAIANNVNTFGLQDVGDCFGGNNSAYD